MLTFFYDSIETLKKVKVPTTKEIINLTITILIVVAISALLFTLFDYVGFNLYELFYDFMRAN